jgi:hypothetical protein
MKAVERAIDNILNFSRFESYWLRRAVAEENRKDSGPGIVFAPPGYGVANAMTADWPWSFGYTSGVDHTTQDGSTYDDTEDIRKEICLEELKYEDQNSGAQEEVDWGSCLYAPIGHPNNEGCRQYADTIVRRYKEYIDKSVRSFADDLDDDTDSLRESLRRYGFLASNGIRQATTHDVVDSIRVRIETGAGTGMGRRRGEVYLKLYSGRNRSGERHRLDTEYNDNARPRGSKTTSTSTR